MAGIALVVAAWWLACALLIVTGCLLIAFAVRNIRGELGGRAMLTFGLLLCVVGAAGIVVYSLT